MDYAAAADALMRRRILEDMYGRMTDEEKMLLVQAAMQRRDGDILKALQRQSAQLQDLRNRQQTFMQDLASNILGNAAWDGAVWLLGRLLGK